MFDESAYKRKWAKDNPAKVSIYRARHKHKIKAQALALYGRACECCGEDNIYFLSLDHINGNGNTERKTGLTPYGSNLYRYLVRHGKQPGLQILCYNCNFGKHTKKDCPHLSDKLTINDLIT